MKSMSRRTLGGFAGDSSFVKRTGFGVQGDVVGCAVVGIELILQVLVGVKNG